MPWAAGAGLELEVEPPPAVAALLRTLGVACNSKVVWSDQHSQNHRFPSIYAERGEKPIPS